MLNLIGRLADGWVPSSFYTPPERLPEMNQRIDAAAVQAGRAPSAVRRLYNVGGRITTGASNGFLDGPAPQWVDTLTSLALDQGMDSFIFAPAEAVASQIEQFANEVVPQVQQYVASARPGQAPRV
jgi:alkanesulfonate monooxygenase SsuD/methylene tetrahydromethanopterin reductase-like flavin-dependent oxidoreductase (luciferase family)